ncbi:MAG: hypothetical protein [Arizlama microvirus]|nr:MAG: hypothetical protein [Arizlama microvirus]
MKRFKIKSKYSKRSFTKSAKFVHRKNGLRPMRGGIRA